MTNVILRNASVQCHDYMHSILDQIHISALNHAHYYETKHKRSHEFNIQVLLRPFLLGPKPYKKYGPAYVSVQYGTLTAVAM